MKYSKEFLSYVGGIIDGEGCIGLYKSHRRHYVPSLTIINSDISILKYIQPIFDVNIIELKKAKDIHKTRYCIDIRSKKLFDLIDIVYDYLVIKKEQFDVILDFKKLLIQNGFKLSQENLDKREILGNKLSNLHRQKEFQPINFDQLQVLPEPYLAAIIDGEGHIGIKKVDNKYYEPKIEIINTDVRLIEYIRYKFNLKSLYLDKRESESIRKCYITSIASKQIADLLPTLKTYVIGKQNQILLLEKLIKTQLIKYGRGGIPQKILDERESYFIEMKRLHKCDTKMN